MYLAWPYLLALVVGSADHRVLDKGDHCVQGPLPERMYKQGFQFIISNSVFG